MHFGCIGGQALLLVLAFCELDHTAVSLRGSALDQGTQRAVNETNVQRKENVGII